MPLYMDVHRNVPKITPEELIGAHMQDLATQDKHHVCYHKYWYNEEAGKIYCLVEGPDKEACDAVHREAHGLVADELIEVDPRVVDAFLGAFNAQDINPAMLGDQLDPGFRVILFTQIGNLAEASRRAGDQYAMKLMKSHDEMVQSLLPQHGGRVASHTGEGIMASFGSAVGALRFASELQKQCAQTPSEVEGFKPRIRVGITVGEPVEEHDQLFGFSVNLARRICEKANPGEVLVSTAVREVATGKGFQFGHRGTHTLKDLDNERLELYNLQDPEAASAAAAAAAAAPMAAKASPAVRSFIAELRRRKVLTVGAVYAGSLFILLQVAQLTFEPLHLPDWSYTLLLVVGIFGFPLALILAWVFDVTSEGIERTED